MSSLQRPPGLTKHRYALEFNVQALREWEKLGSTVRLQFANKLKERMDNPRVIADKLKGMPNCYKIKLRTSGYRLVYEVIEQVLVITVIAVGKRERSEVYRQASGRTSESDLPVS